VFERTGLPPFNTRSRGKQWRNRGRTPISGWRNQKTWPVPDFAQAEGLFCEPASAIALAGVLKDLELGKIGEGSVIVCTLTGHGLKDPDVAIAQSAKPVTVDAELRAIERVIREHLKT
jgi:hypothetical protein